MSEEKLSLRMYRWITPALGGARRHVGTSDHVDFDKFIKEIEILESNCVGLTEEKKVREDLFHSWENEKIRADILEMKNAKLIRKLDKIPKNIADAYGNLIVLEERINKTLELLTFYKNNWMKQQQGIFYPDWGYMIETLEEFESVLKGDKD